MSESNGKGKEVASGDQNAAPPPVRWVTLESGDGYKFIVDFTTVTRIGSTIPNMLAMSESGGFAEAQAGKAYFPHVRGVILEKVIEFLAWNQQHSQPRGNPIKFNPADFERRIPPEMVLELFMSADFFEL